MQDITGKNVKKIKLLSKVTSIMLVEEKINDYLLYKWLITGDEAGVVRIQVISDDEKAEIFVLPSLDISTHITSICVADLRNESRKEIIVISANGFLCGYNFPSFDALSDPLIPASISLLHPQMSIQQIMLPNIVSAFINDFSSNSGIELYVMMTDRVIRSYRFNTRRNKFIPLRKWDLLLHIDAWGIGRDFRKNFSYYTQLTVRSKFKRLVIDFHGDEIISCNGLVDNNKIISNENILCLPMMPMYVSCPVKHINKIAISNFKSKTYHYLLLPNNYYVTCIAASSSLKTDQSYAVCINNNGIVLIYSWKCPLETSIAPIYRSFVGGDVKKVYITPLATENIAAIFVDYLGNITYSEYYYSDRTKPIYSANNF
uniref:RAB3GAP2_N domain-containing protein n=1 Tax=Parastrongyloides trichosuri TaxID=131310 RepID=A0A0N4ZST7_PARTI